MAKSRFRFSASSLSKLEIPAKGYVYHYDSTVPSLCCRVSHTGRKVFVHVRSGGKRLTINTTDLADARDYCRRHDSESAARESAASGWNLGQLQRHWMEHYAIPHKRSANRDQARFRLHLSRWEAKPLKQISATMVQAWHSGLNETSGPYAANAALSYLSSLFTYVNGVSLRAGIVNPCAGIKRFPQQSRRRWLSATELGRFFEAVESLQRQQAKDFLKLAVFTGQRRQLILSMKWENVDLESRKWFIPASTNKSKRDQTVALAVPAVEILKRRHNERVPNAEWVFASTQSRTGHYNDPNTAWRKVKELSGLQDVRIHDLRRTLGSVMINSGETIKVVGAALGHKSTAATHIYARVHDDTVAAAVESAAKQIVMAAD